MSEIDSYIPDVARQDSDELSLGLAKLIVEAAKDATYGKRLIVLYKVVREADGGESGCVINFSEPTATISKALGLDQFDVLQ